jgi:hypothetical protein
VGVVLLACVLLGGMLVGCSSQRRAWTNEDSWYKAPPSETLVWTWPDLDRERLHEVVETEEAEAEQLLDDVAVVELTSDEAAEFVGEALPEIPGTKPYLTRGLYLIRGTGSFSVYVSEDQLAVTHGSLGRSAQSMKRQALVLQLERAPVEVFVTCSMAE